jgi:hypothetical protein
MKLPDSWNKESSHKTKPLNTFSLLAISLVWGHMLNLITPWMLPVTMFALLVAVGGEIEKRQSK